LLDPEIENILKNYGILKLVYCFSKKKWDMQTSSYSYDDVCISAP